MIVDLYARRPGCTSGQFKAIATTMPGHDHAPRFHVVNDAPDPSVSIKEDEVDRVPHERRVNRRGAFEEQPLTGAKPRQEMKAKDPRDEPARDLALVRDRLAGPAMHDTDEIVRGHRDSLARAGVCENLCVRLHRLAGAEITRRAECP